MARAIMRQPLLLLCLFVGHRQAAAASKTTQAETGDILVASTPIAPSKASDGSDITIYSAGGKLKNSLHLSFYPGDAPASLGISGSADYAFFGSGSSQGRLAIVRIAGGELKDMGTFSGGKNLQLSQTGGIASGDVSSDGAAFVYVSEGVGSKACKLSKGRSIATQIVELRFTPGSNGKKSTLKRERIFDAFRSSICSEKANVVLALRTIGDKLYAVVEEKPGEYTLRSYDAFSSLKKSSPIVRYSASAISAATIDSPTSFVAQGLKPDSTGGYFATQYQIRIAKGEKPIYGTSAPGKANSNGPRLYYGGISSYTDGKGIVAATGALNNQGYGPVGNSIYKFNANTLLDPRQLFTLKPAAMGQDLVVVPKPRDVPV